MVKKFNCRSTIGLTKEILTFLADGLSVTIDVFLETPYKGIGYKKTYDTLYRLDRSKDICKIKKHSGLFYKITPKGQQKILFSRLKEKFNKNKFHWDGKWRVLIFDVPEDQRGCREFLRQKLRELNFLRLQDSVWVTPRVVDKEFEKFIQFFGLKYFVRCLIAESINYDLDLRRKFNLK